jgi:hypothetical protein
MPYKRNRDFANVHSVLYLITRIEKQTIDTKASQIIVHIINTISPVLRVNDIMDRAADFRRKLRFLQKHWHTKFHNRLQLIKLAGERHVYNLLDQFPKFSNVKDVFKTGNHMQKLAIEYIKETASKFNEMYLSYHRRLDELYDQNRLNE